MTDISRRLKVQDVPSLQDKVAILCSPHRGMVHEITIADVFLLMHPVGSILISVSSTNPGTTYGGTWAAFGTGRTLVGIDSGDTDFDTVEETGGAKTVASAGTISSISATEDAGTNVQLVGSDVAAVTHTHPAPTFTGSATSVVQPYIVVYMWKRTA